MDALDEFYQDNDSFTKEQSPENIGRVSNYTNQAKNRQQYHKKVRNLFDKNIGDDEHD